MEHLPLPGGVAPILVPYVCTEEYDGGDFVSYPTRKGWDFSVWLTGFNWGRDPLDVIRWLPDGKSMDNLAALLQTWLFFGLISSVASAMKLRVELGDFIRTDEGGQSWITTESLPRYLNDLHQARDDYSRSTWEGMLATISIDLRHSSAIIDTLAGVVDCSAKKRSRKLKAIHFSCLLLNGVLNEAVIEFFRPGNSVRMSLVQLSRSSSLLLDKLMQRQGWCTSAMSRLRDIVSINLRSYMYVLGTVQCSNDHSLCRDTLCEHSQIDHSYKPRHTRQGCECALLSTPIKELVAMLSAGHIPVLTIAPRSNTSNVPALCVEQRTTHTPYVAISHVWADGLGNPTANAIPQCQLEDLLEGLRSISQEVQSGDGEKRGIPFWLDTLCIPVDDVYQNLRDFSIQKMRDIYKDALAVLVLDSDLRRLTLDASDTEVLARVLSCNWSTRLWTYQEAALSDQLIIRGNHCLFYFDRILQHRTSSAQKSTILDLLETVTVRRCRETIRRGSPVVSDQSDWDIQQLFCDIVNRVTSRSGDETICIASYLGLDATPLLRASPGDRMQLLLEMLPNIPANVPFCSGPRNFQKGFRWAPRTFLASNSVTRGSNLVPRLHTPDSVRRPMAHLHPDRKGLMIMLPAIRLHGLHLSDLRRAQHGYFGLGNGRIHRIHVVTQFERARSCEPGTQELAILLPFRDRVVTKDGVEGEGFGILIQSFNETLEPPSCRPGMGMLKLVNYLGFVDLQHFDEHALRLDGSLIDGELIQLRWWLIDGEPYQAPEAFPTDGFGTSED